MMNTPQVSPSLRRPFLARVSLIAVLFVLVYSIVGLFWLVWPYHIMTIQDLQVLEPEVVAGERMVLKMTYCKSSRYDETEASVQYSFHDDLNYGVLGSTSGYIPSGCGVFEEVIPVPLLPAGVYTLEMIRNYRVNPIRSIIIKKTSNRFKIIGTVVLKESK